MNTLTLEADSLRQIWYGDWFPYQRKRVTERDGGAKEDWDTHTVAFKVTTKMVWNALAPH